VRGPGPLLACSRASSGSRPDCRCIAGWTVPDHAVRLPSGSMVGLSVAVVVAAALAVAHRRRRRGRLPGEPRPGIRRHDADADETLRWLERCGPSRWMPAAAGSGRYPAPSMVAAEDGPLLPRGQLQSIPPAADGPFPAWAADKAPVGPAGVPAAAGRLVREDASVRRMWPRGRRRMVRVWTAGRRWSRAWSGATQLPRTGC
jgi:hypothetical protein